MYHEDSGRSQFWSQGRLEMKLIALGVDIAKFEQGAPSGQRAVVVVVVVTGRDGGGVQMFKAQTLRSKRADRGAGRDRP